MGGEMTNIAIPRSARLMLGLLEDATGNTAGGVVAALIRNAADRYDVNPADETKSILIDYGTRTMRTETVGGQVWTAPLSKRMWDAFRSDCWRDMNFDLGENENA